MNKEDVAYQEWIKDVEGKLPDEVKEDFKTLTNHDAGREVFRGVTRREDYNRRVNEVEGKRRMLDEWFQTEAPKNAKLVKDFADAQTKLSTYEQTLRDLGLNDEPSAPAKVTAASVARKDEIEDLRKELDAKLKVIDQALPKLLGDLSTVIQKTVKEGYNIDPRDVIAYAVERQTDALTAFDSLTAGERQKREETKVKAEQEKWKEEGRREALSKLPTPDRLRPTGPTVIDALSDKNFSSDHRSRVSAAVKDFLEGDYEKSGSSLA